MRNGFAPRGHVTLIDRWIGDDDRMTVQRSRWLCATRSTAIQKTRGWGALAADGVIFEFEWTWHVWELGEGQ